MAKQIAFFEKNFLDLDNDAATITATQANDFAKFVRNRNLKTAWITTGSVDADNPQIEFDLASTFNIDTILLIDHNLKSYTVEQFNGTSWDEIFSETADSENTTEISFTPDFYGQRFRITILGTQVANSDKRLGRIVVTKKIGRFSQWPQIKSPTLARGKVIRSTLSGKPNILRTVGAFKCKLDIGNWRNQNDLALIERLYRQVQGFEVWLCGGDEDQFFYPVEGYRKKDVYLMGLQNDLIPQWNRGIYVNGLDITLDLVEVVR